MRTERKLSLSKVSIIFLELIYLKENSYTLTRYPEVIDRVCDCSHNANVGETILPKI